MSGNKHGITFNAGVIFLILFIGAISFGVGTSFVFPKTVTSTSTITSILTTTTTMQLWMEATQHQNSCGPGCITFTYSCPKDYLEILPMCYLSSLTHRQDNLVKEAIYQSKATVVGVNLYSNHTRLDLNPAIRCYNFDVWQKNLTLPTQAFQHYSLNQSIMISYSWDKIDHNTVWFNGTILATLGSSGCNAFHLVNISP